MYNRNSKTESDWRQIHAAIQAAPGNRAAILQQHGAKLNSYYSAAARFNFKSSKAKQQQPKKAKANGHFAEFTAAGREPVVVRIPGSEIEIRIPAGDEASLLAVIRASRQQGGAAK